VHWGKPVSPAERLQRAWPKRRSLASSAFDQLQLSCGASMDRTWRKWSEKVKRAYSDRCDTIRTRFDSILTVLENRRWWRTQAQKRTLRNCYRCACADRPYLLLRYLGLITNAPLENPPEKPPIRVVCLHFSTVVCASVSARGHLSGKTFFPSEAFFLCITKEN